MMYLYGTKPNVSRKLVASFDSESQLRAYVGWSTLKINHDGTRRFEQGSELVGFTGFESSDRLLTDEDETQIPHNPTPTML